MLYKANDLKGLALHATDGELGKCQDFLFDNEHWAVRYMDARAGNWFTGRRVLISPISLGPPNWERQELPVELTREQIKKSPPITEEQPVSRRFESTFFNYYGYSYYWMGGEAWGAGIYPHGLVGNTAGQKIPREQDDDDPHLLSVNEVTHYDVFCNDEKVGTMDDFLVDDSNWILRYIIVDTGNWLSHNRVVIPPHWLDGIYWAEHRVSLKLPKAQLEQAPPYPDEGPLSREYEERYFKHFGQPPYWRD